MKRMALFVLAMLLTGALLAPSPFERRLNIPVYPFKNEGPRRFSWMSCGMTGTEIADLMRLNSVNVFSDDDRKKAIQEIEPGTAGLVKESDVPGVGRIMGANLIFTGSYTVTGRSVWVIARLANVETTKIQKP